MTRFRLFYVRAAEEVDFYIFFCIVVGEKRVVINEYISVKVCSFGNNFQSMFVCAAWRLYLLKHIYKDLQQSDAWTCSG